MLIGSFCSSKFLSTPSARRATWLSSLSARRWRISIHALREEGDRGCPDGPADYFYFYPRPPRGGRHSHFESRAVFLLFLSTPSARRATRREPDVGGHHAISIHALREEGDVAGQRRRVRRRISIHALREEGDAIGERQDVKRLISIHALREEGDATPAASSPMALDFYPRPPRGGRPAASPGWLCSS